MQEKPINESGARMYQVSSKRLGGVVSVAPTPNPNKLPE
jgi:hypothetical protein